jgi:hypothetical protein
MIMTKGYKFHHRKFFFIFRTQFKTENQLRQCSKQMQDSVIGVKAAIDGIIVGDLDKYRIQSPLFSFTLPKNNILGLPSYITTQSVSDGNWVFLKPLSVGKHILYFKGNLRKYITKPSKFFSRL